MTGLINSNNGFDPLIECWLGDCYPPSFFDYVENTKVRDVLRRITEETIEDLENIKEVIESYGAIVKRPKVLGFDDVYRVYHLGRENLNANLQPLNPLAPIPDVNNLEPGPLTRPPLFPRDAQVVVDNKIYRLSADDLNKAGNDAYTDLYANLDPSSIVSDLPRGSGNQGPNVIRLGNTIILDGLPVATYSYFRKLFKEQGYQIITAFNDGHSDGMYNPIKPGLWISNGKPFDMDFYFPNWETFYLPDAQWSNMSPFLDVKSKVEGKWWIPGEEKNDDLIDFVGAWFSDWIGFCEETVWDVNVFSINPETIICLSENKDLFKWLRGHNVEPIITPFRHRFFWDGGLHCLTLDTARDGGRISYKL